MFSWSRGSNVLALFFATPTFQLAGSRPTRRLALLCCIPLSRKSFLVTDSTESFSNEHYFNGLRDADEPVLESVYAEFRQPVVRAVTELGGSEAAGKAFFRTALVEAARISRTDEIPTETSFLLQLKSLAVAHYKDWLSEREQPIPEETTEEGTTEIPVAIPPAETLRETRQAIEFWKKGERTDDEGYALWEKMRLVERKFSDDIPTKSKNNLARNLFIFFVLLTVGWLIWLYVFRAKTPAEVYDDNFAPPESIMADIRQRYGPAMGNDSVSTRPSECEFLLNEADEFYKAKDFDSAQSVLFEILEQELVLCHSDALFYIGIIALEQEEPGLTLECFAKIEDLENFGEDIYWYQALAFVKLAEKNPLLRDKAVRAVERTRANTRDSLRRVQAEKMLKHLEN